MYLHEEDGVLLVLYMYVQRTYVQQTGFLPQSSVYKYVSGKNPYHRHISAMAGDFAL